MPDFRIAGSQNRKSRKTKVVAEIKLFRTKHARPAGSAWKYPNGLNYTSASGETLRIPIDVPVVFEVTSGDVFHSYALPEHRIKVDAIPGRVNSGWIHAEETGIYPVRCFELCGDYHSIMIGELEVMDKDDFDTWYMGGDS